MPEVRWTVVSNEYNQPLAKNQWDAGKSHMDMVLFTLFTHGNIRDVMGTYHTCLTAFYCLFFKNKL